MRELDAWLTPEERDAGRRFGALMKFGEAGVAPKDIDAFVKKAWDPGLTVGNTARSVVVLSALTGIPLGIAAHSMGKQIRKSRGKEDELAAQSRYYRDAAKQISRGHV